MVRDSKKKDKKSKESAFKKFLKKRAPVYLAVIAIVVIFIVPELTKGDLQSSFPQDFSDEEKLVVHTLMDYDGPNDEGLTIMKAIENQISETYPNERIYDNKNTKVDISVSKLEEENYRVIFDFQSHKEDFHFDWNVDMENGEVDGNDMDSKYIIDLVDFYD